MLREILEEDDFAWPKAYSLNPRGGHGDHIQWLDPETGSWKKVWSPVRAYVVLLKLELPLRTFQVRMLNSGEADPERYDHVTRTWEPNTHALKGTTDTGKPQGAIARIRDQHEALDRVGIYVNTNKTADIGRENSARGYVIPWENERVIELLSQLRRWQEAFNPIRSATPWSNLADHYIRASYHAETLEERGAECFLFRDPCSRRREQPVASGRMQQFWYNLCAELERRLAKLGEVGRDGQAPSLVRRGPSGITSAVYDLHSLRVTLLTAWGEAGVPVTILMKVAGHCTAIMTIFYQKYSIAHITQVLDRAEVERIHNEQVNWEQHLRSQAYENLRQLVAWNDDSGPRALADGSGASWQRRDHGICPVGCARCGDGGELVVNTGSMKRYGPVPGGPQNCVCCRFFITGPAFLIGLTAFFNSTTCRLREASKTFAESERAYDRIDSARKRATDAGVPFDRLSQWQVSASTLDQRTRELDTVALTWHATYRLIEKCRSIIRTPPATLSEGKFALVPVGTIEDIEFIIELDECGEREFELLDAVCQSAVWFTSIDAAQPNLKRMRYFDAMLQRNGYDAAFVGLSEEEGYVAGNELAKFMFTQYGRETTIALMNGTTILRQVGLDGERAVIDLIELSINRRLKSPETLLLAGGKPVAQTDENVEE
jgi:hypothetical protein